MRVYELLEMDVLELDRILERYGLPLRTRNTVLGYRRPPCWRGSYLESFTMAERRGVNGVLGMDEDDRIEKVMRLCDYLGMDMRGDWDRNQLRNTGLIGGGLGRLHGGR